MKISQPQLSGVSPHSEQRKDIWISRTTRRRLEATEYAFSHSDRDRILSGPYVSCRVSVRGIGPSRPMRDPDPRSVLSHAVFYVLDAEGPRMKHTFTVRPVDE